MCLWKIENQHTILYYIKVSYYLLLFSQRIWYFVHILILYMNLQLVYSQLTFLNFFKSFLLSQIIPLAKNCIQIILLSYQQQELNSQ